MDYQQPAPFDVQEVNTDWIASMLDTFNRSLIGYHTYVGTIRDCLVTCRYDENRLRWLVYAEDGDPMKSLHILYERLKAATLPMKGVRSELLTTCYRDYSTKYQIIQTFYYE